MIFRILALDRPARTIDFDIIIVNFHQHCPTQRPVHMGKGIDDRLTHRLTRNLWNLFARSAVLDDKTPASAFEDIALCNVDKRKDRSLFLTKVENLRTGMRCERNAKELFPESRCKSR